ncbi:ATP-grasp domain-containing protein [Pseudogracilibacillus sp. SO10305]|uniref:ATP-grasp domain-containing protein n=1 Tax=Pseudogracilibacillus sp. SO10305 TaxID=3098292 RepID=UPI00300E2505
MKTYTWLPHIIDIPQEAKRNRTSLYTIALEGWRRGLTLKFHNIKTNPNASKFVYSLSSKERVHFFQESCGDMVTEEAREICDNKQLTQEYLQKAEIPTPLSVSFIKNENVKTILNSISDMVYPLVVKPIDGSGGKGVKTNINSELELIEAINQVRSKVSEKIIIQEQVHGDEVRIYVLGNEVIAAVKRVPANVVGDGVKTINELIKEKNDLRKKTPHLYYRAIVIDKAMHNKLKDYGLTVDSVLPEGKRIYLNTISNVSAGGEPIDFTDQITEKQKRIAIRANQAIPGLAHSGIDMIVNDTDGTGIILELNTRPGIGSHLYPIEGKAVDVPRKIIDYYFPETITVREKKFKGNYYFDFQTVLNSLNNGYLEEIEISPCPEKEYSAKLIKLIGEIDIINIYSALKKIILREGINGYIEREKSINILLAHYNEKVIEGIIDYINERQHNFFIKEIQITEYRGPLQLGFKIKDDYQHLGIVELEHKFKENEKFLKGNTQEIKRIEKKLMRIKTSTSWKITKIIRKIK